MNTKENSGTNGRMTSKTLLILSTLATIFFVVVVVYYIVSPYYLGIYPIGIIAGICILLQILMLMVSVKKFLNKANRFTVTVALVVEIISIIGIGYWFLIWWMII